MDKVTSPITWFGSKSRQLKDLLPLFPKHKTFVDVFGGSGSVILNKEPSVIDVYNDKDTRLVNLFTVLRNKDLCEQLLDSLKLTLYARTEFKNSLQNTDDCVENARCFITRMRQSYSGMGLVWSYCVDDDICSTIGRWNKVITSLRPVIDRFRSIQVECDDWSNILKRYDTKETLFYLDPPYVAETRVSGNYVCEMTNDEHYSLVNVITDLKGMTILSGYENSIYDCLDNYDWTKIIYTVNCQITPKNKSKRKECLWLSPNIKKPVAVPDLFD